METLVDLKTMLEIDGRDYAMTVTGITIADASIGPYEFWGSRYVDPYTPGIEGWEIGRIVRALKDQANIPGIRVWSEKTVAARTAFECPGCEVALESNRGEIRREGERFFCRFCGEELHDDRLVDWNIEEPENGRTNLTAGGHDR